MESRDPQVWMAPRAPMGALEFQVSQVMQVLMAQLDHRVTQDSKDLLDHLVFMDWMDSKE